MGGCDIFARTSCITSPHYIHFQKEYGVGTDALSLSVWTVLEKMMDSITPVALTAHHTPNLVYCTGTSHIRQ
jgi:hypothetical protein